MVQTAYVKRVKSSSDKAEAYTQRRVKKHAAEMALVERALDDLSPVETFLDAPCGVGRVTILLEQRGYRAMGVDLGDAALALAKREIEGLGLGAGVQKADLEALPFADRAFDGLICFRFFHHLPSPGIRARIVAELCRVSAKYVLISYLSPFSVTSIKRDLRMRLSGRASVQHATSLREVSGYLEANGFRLVRDYPLRQFAHTLHLAVFERKGE